MQVGLPQWITTNRMLKLSQYEITGSPSMPQLMLENLLVLELTALVTAPVQAASWQRANLKSLFVWSRYVITGSPSTPAIIEDSEPTSLVLSTVVMVALVQTASSQ